jgi:hypothetical protein
MPAQNQGGASVVVLRAKVAMTRGCAVRVTANEDECDLPGATNDAASFGFALSDAAIGELVTIQHAGGIAPAQAGGTIAIGDYVGVTGTAGLVAKVTLGASNQFVLGQAVRAAASGDLFYVAMNKFIAQGA